MISSLLGCPVSSVGAVSISDGSVSHTYREADARRTRAVACCCALALIRLPLPLNHPLCLRQVSDARREEVRSVCLARGATTTEKKNTQESARREGQEPDGHLPRPLSLVRLPFAHRCPCKMGWRCPSYSQRTRELFRGGPLGSFTYRSEKKEGNTKYKTTWAHP